MGAAGGCRQDERAGRLSRRHTSWQPQVAASILTADFGHLDRAVRKLERAGIDRLHLDVMDGHFVPNLTFGPDIVAAVRRLTTLPIDVHLMISHPSRIVDRFLGASPQTVTFHVEAPEADEVKASVLQTIRDAGSGAGLAVSPATPIEAAEPFIGQLDLVMVMTVEPGFGGQRFLGEAAPKLAEAGELFERHHLRGSVHVDGGVNRDTAAVVGAWGADVCVVGSALFQRGRDAADEVSLVRERAAEARRVGPEDGRTADVLAVAGASAPR
jgi:ribulose-phosphate 3-epimerase